MKVHAIIPSGGSGKRTGGSVPKQYVEFNGKPLIAYTLKVFQDCDLVDNIIIAAQPDYFEFLENIKTKYGITKLHSIVEGGKERQHSVYNALNSLSPSGKDLVAVHDAARPLLPAETLTNAINTANEKETCVVAIKARDTLIKGNDSVADYVDRSEIYYAQTPQIFRYGILKDAMDKADKDGFIGTDESMLVKKAGYEVNIAEGSIFNLKITTKEDLFLFNILMGFIPGK